MTSPFDIGSRRFQWEVLQSLWQEASNYELILSFYMLWYEIEAALVRTSSIVKLRLARSFHVLLRFMHPCSLRLQAFEDLQQTVQTQWRQKGRGSTATEGPSRTQKSSSIGSTPRGLLYCKRFNTAYLRLANDLPERGESVVPNSIFHGG